MKLQIRDDETKIELKDSSAAIVLDDDGITVYIPSKEDVSPEPARMATCLVTLLDESNHDLWTTLFARFVRRLEKERQNEVHRASPD